MLSQPTNSSFAYSEKDSLRALGSHPSPLMDTFSLGEEQDSNVQRKRKVDEIADSQDEDDSDAEYGWVDDDAGLLEK